MPELKLTEKRILELEVPPGKPYERFWDTEAKGLCVKVTSAGLKRYYFKGRIKGDSKPIWHTGPRCSDYSLEEMRDDVRRWKVELRKGDNPFHEEEIVEEKVPTIYELCLENLRRKEQQKAPTLSRGYLKDVRMYTDWVRKSDLGAKNVNSITPLDGDVFLGEYAPRCADHMRAWLVNSYSFAIQRAYVPLGFNPWQYIEKKYLAPRAEDLPRFTDDEIGSIAEYLRKAEDGRLARRVNPIWVKFVWFLIRNGTRPNDTRIIERAWLTERNGVFYVLHPKTKTGEKRIMLSKESLRDVDEVMKMADSKFLFPGRSGECHLQNYRKEFNYMRDAIGIDKPPYAIRRWFAHVGREVYDGDIAPVQQLVGWETKEMALRYSGNDEAFMEKMILENAEICRAVSSKVEEVANAF